MSSRKGLVVGMAINFGWEYPAGSMRGSGIYSDSWDGERYCAECGKDMPGTYEKDDWGGVTWHCDEEHDDYEEVDASEFERDDFDRDDDAECPDFYDGTGRW